MDTFLTIKAFLFLFLYFLAININPINALVYDWNLSIHEDVNRPETSANIGNASENF